MCVGIKQATVHSFNQTDSDSLTTNLQFFDICFGKSGVEISRLVSSPEFLVIILVIVVQPRHPLSQDLLQRQNFSARVLTCQGCRVSD